MKTRQQVEERLNSLREQRRNVMELLDNFNKDKERYGFEIEIYESIRKNYCAQISTLFWMLQDD